MSMIKVIIPRDLVIDPAAFKRAIRNGLTASAKGAKVDFEVTTQTWTHKPDFAIDEPDDMSRTISTDNEIYGFVNDGTRPHVIVAKGKALSFGVPSAAKTTPRVIGSSAGSRGSTIVNVKKVQHPGTEPRAFDEVIAEKWEKEFPITLQRAIDSEM